LNILSPKTFFCLILPFMIIYISCQFVGTALPITPLSMHHIPPKGV
jgi:hypothetical protein